jgi:hypothetical protein
VIIVGRIADSTIYIKKNCIYEKNNMGDSANRPTVLISNNLSLLDGISALLDAEINSA